VITPETPPNREAGDGGGTTLMELPPSPDLKVVYNVATQRTVLVSDGNTFIPTRY
jgi:hypothetical protein